MGDENTKKTGLILMFVWFAIAGAYFFWTKNAAAGVGALVMAEFMHMRSKGVY